MSQDKREMPALSDGSGDPCRCSRPSTFYLMMGPVRVTLHPPHGHPRHGGQSPSVINVTFLRLPYLTLRYYDMIGIIMTMKKMVMTNQHHHRHPHHLPLHHHHCHHHHDHPGASDQWLGPGRVSASGGGRQIT